MTMSERSEEPASVLARDGPREAATGLYCGTFDIELRARGSCIAVLTTVADGRAYVLVGQTDEREKRVAELTLLMRSIVVGVPGVDIVAPADGSPSLVIPRAARDEAP